MASVVGPTAPTRPWERISDWVNHFIRSNARSPNMSELTLVGRIADMESRFDQITDTELLEEASWLRRRVAVERGEIGDEFLCHGFALANESLFRARSFRYYPVQLLAGIVLARGYIAEMQTGEGKTLTAALPAFLLGLRGEGVHVATVNAYLAERDADEVSPILRRLGISVGKLTDDGSPEEKREAYLCDVTYGTGYAFGFDYLRDQLVFRGRVTGSGQHRFRESLRGRSAGQTLQRRLAIAVIDEADSVMIDDAATPLILGGAAGEEAPDVQAHRAAREVALSLTSETHFELDQLQDRISLTESGIDAIHESQVTIPSNCLLRPWSDYVEIALRAEHLLRRDVHYIINDEEVQIVDQTTGRIHSERQWRGGVQQAVQTREGVKVEAETDTLARVTRQRFFQLYRGVCGMTGTATGGTQELREMYRAKVVRIPTNRPCLREVYRHRSFATAEAKWSAVAEEVAELQSAGRPVLVGTRTIAASELIANLLDARGVDYRLLNGKQDGEEAEIVGKAGDSGIVTIATNMAGRGTDIGLTSAAHDAGGLHVIATEHHESARIDRQLAGRAARQGDPGSVRFYAAADDNLIERYDQDLARRMIRVADSTGATGLDLSPDIARLQQRVERYQFQRRREMYEQDRVQNEILRLGKGYL